MRNPPDPFRGERCPGRPARAADQASRIHRAIARPLGRGGRPCLRSRLSRMARPAGRALSPSATEPRRRVSARTGDGPSRFRPPGGHAATASASPARFRQVAMWTRQAAARAATITASSLVAYHQSLSIALPRLLAPWVLIPIRGSHRRLSGSTATLSGSTSQCAADSDDASRTSTHPLRSPGCFRSRGSGTSRAPVPASPSARGCASRRGFRSLPCGGSPPTVDPPSVAPNDRCRPAWSDPAATVSCRPSLPASVARVLRRSTRTRQHRPAASPGSPLRSDLAGAR